MSATTKDSRIAVRLTSEQDALIRQAAEVEGAFANQSSGASRCFVTTRGRRVVGYYSLSTGSVQRFGLPKRVSRNQPDPVPVILLGRLAVDFEPSPTDGLHLVLRMQDARAVVHGQR
jgi:hypothetical protein